MLEANRGYNAEGYCRKCGAALGIDGHCMICSMNKELEADYSIELDRAIEVWVSTTNKSILIYTTRQTIKIKEHYSGYCSVMLNLMENWVESDNKDGIYIEYVRK